MEAKLQLGRLLATPGALEALQRSAQGVTEFLVRHLSGDWGELSQEDAQENNHALTQGLRVLSSYRLKSGVRIWVITEADRSATTFLLPEEY